ncbi:MAG: hypothetical protein K6V97_14400 [Actinomycetia bacterium]|nr:hypothetical protein [Actinomycetes bacterium]
MRGGTPGPGPGADGDDGGRWALWAERQAALLAEPVRRLVRALPPGPEQARWIQAARRPPSPTAEAVREWLDPDGRWVLVPGIRVEGVAAAGGALLMYPEVDEDDPVVLATVALEAVALGAAEASAVGRRLGLAAAAVTERWGDVPEGLLPALAAFRGWFRAAGEPAWAAALETWARACGAGEGPWTGDPEEPALARRLLVLGLPPHRPPGEPPLAPGSILLALATLQAEGATGLEPLAAKAIEGSTLLARWEVLERHGRR